uniref:uncharacterized protein LOC120342478 n=1 Tax=Styela clava TaxID=7725 RepID=UPI0019398088|nr:uncharacterized protein LOC120342478 [Styela clava]
MAVEGLDLTVFTNPERDEILKVLERDKLVRQMDEKRISIAKTLKNTISIVKFKLLSGEWVREAKKNSLRNHGQTAKYIRKSFQNLRPTGNSNAIIDESKKPEKIEATELRNQQETEQKLLLKRTPEPSFTPENKNDQVPYETILGHSHEVQELGGVFPTQSNQQTTKRCTKLGQGRPRYRSEPEDKPSTLQEILATLSITSPVQRRRYLSTPGRVGKETIKITEEEKSIFDALVIRDPVDETAPTISNNQNFFTIKHKHEVDMNVVREMVRKETIMTTGTEPPTRRKRIDNPTS